MASSYDKFNPEEAHSSVLEAFQDFVSEFRYTYDALARDPPATVREDNQIRQWRVKDQRKVFLGRFAHRNMQKLYEEMIPAADHDGMTFDNMVRAFTDRFRLSTNLTLANYKFRKMTQMSDESFEAFTIRVKREAQNCDFKCGNTCTVINTLIRDQILFGTREDEVRKTALKNQWSTEQLQDQGRAIIASDKGVAVIKQEPTDEVRRTRPGKYSRKYVDQKKDKTSYFKGSNQSRSQQKCSRCSTPRCSGDRRCPGRKTTCFSCGKLGHFRGAQACEKKTYFKKSRRVDGEENSDSSDSEVFEHMDTEEDVSPSSELEEDSDEGNTGKASR